jgi:hypothetical protein
MRRQQMTYDREDEEAAERMRREHAELLDRLGRTLLSEVLGSAKKEAPLITAALKALAEARTLAGAGPEEEELEKEYPGMDLENA